VSPLRDDPRILVAADTVHHAVPVARRLADTFAAVRVSTNPADIASDFEVYRPNVLVLAFDTLDGAKRCCDRLYGESTLVHETAHKTIVLCGPDDVRRVYDACKEGTFDDYVVFWPATHDGPRLALAIDHALHLLSNAQSDAPAAGRLAAYARHLASLEPALERYARSFAAQVDVTHTVAAATPCRNGDGDALRSHFDRLGESVDALCRAAQALASALGPQLRAAHAMNAITGHLRPHVLAVDDDGLQRCTLERLLAGTRVDLTCAASGAQAFRAIRARRPDLVLTDVDLPDLSGMELTRRLKSVEPLAQIPIIMVAGESRRTVVLESVRAGAADFMVKPFCRSTLIDKLEAFLPGAIV
jgi:PleD family two-component response regulator